MAKNFFLTITPLNEFFYYLTAGNDQVA